MGFLSLRGKVAVIAVSLLSGCSCWAQSNVQVISTPSADLGASIAAACAAAGPNGQIKVNVAGGTLSTSPFNNCASATAIEFGPGEFVFTGAASANTIAVNGLKIRGAGKGATVFDLSSATDDFLTVNGRYFELSGMHIRPAPGVLRTAGNILIAHASLGKVHDLMVVDPWNGFFMEGGTTGAWSFEDISIATSGGNWNYLFRTYAASGTSTSFIIRNISGSLSDGVQNGPLMIFDSRTDTVSLSDLNIVGAGGQPIVRCQDIDKAGVGQWPRWVHFTNSFLEAKNATVIDVRNGRDVSYQNGYLSGANSGISVGAGAFDTKIIGNAFPNLARQAITIANGSKATIIKGNTFDSDGSSANATYPIIDVAANADDFTIEGNQAYSFYPSTQWPNYGVRIAAGTSTRFSVTNNNFQQVKVGSVRNGTAAGTLYNVSGNMP